VFPATVVDEGCAPAEKVNGLVGASASESGVIEKAETLFEAALVR